MGGLGLDAGVDGEAAYGRNAAGVYTERTHLGLKTKGRRLLTKPKRIHRRSETLMARLV